VTEVAGDVLGQLIDGRVAAFRFLAQRLQRDRVEVVLQSATQVGGCEPARAGGLRITGIGGATPHDCGGGPYRFVLDDGACGFQCTAVASERVGTGEQLVEQQAEAVHIGRRRDVAAADLFGCGVIGRQQHEAGACFRLTGARFGSRKQFRNPEIEQLDAAILGDEHIGRFEVAVHDQTRVRVLHGVADGQEQPEPVIDAEPAPITVRRDRLALDLLHHQIELTVIGRAAIEQAGDVRMIEAGQDLAFGAEPAGQIVGDTVAAQQFDGDLLRVLAVAALAEVDVAHAAASNAADQTPCVDLRTDAGVDGGRTFVLA